MVGLGWSMRHTTMQRHNQPSKQMPSSYQSSSSSSPIACRVCEQVFASTQALINHIESCIRNEDYNISCSSRKHHNLTLNAVPSPAMPTAIPHKGQPPAPTTAGAGMRNYIANPLPPGFTFPARNLTGCGQCQNGFLTLAPPQLGGPLLAPVMPPLHIPVMVRTNYAYGQPQMQIQSNFGSGYQADTSDRTMPLLHQLEKRKPESFLPYHGHGSSSESASDYIDTTLKL